ncbi:MAG TPA: VOC family protein [Thermoanaerobaculia bacterium]|jgi:uncharacterized glyoxalase superfamily protein PhnB|nr:VOC family protein [Thermoanaerobaculia bacterium]
MAERDRYEKLNDAIEDVIAGTVPTFEPELAALLVVAAELRDLPDPRFMARLREELIPNPKEENDMEATAIATHLRPYLIVNGATDLIAFLQKTFDAEVLLNVPTPTGTVMHAEVRVGDSILEMGDANERWTTIAAPQHVYIDDVDEAYRRALDAGATSIYEPTTQPYGDREAGVVDRFGIQWFIATHQGESSRPPGFSTVTSGFIAADAEATLAFLQKAFGAVELGRTTLPTGAIQHAEIRIGETMVELSEAHDRWTATKGAFHLFVDDCDAVYARSLRAGGTSLMPPEDKPYGERSASVEDPFGNQWYIATPLA